MKKLMLIALVAALVGCGSNLDANRPAPDQCMRAQMFQHCMAALPAGPKSTVYNDWDEVVDSCESTAYYQSLRPAKSIKPECRSDGY